MTQGEFSQHEGEDLETTRPNPQVQAERKRLRDDLKDIAEQANGSQTEAETPISEEQARAERKAQREDAFFGEGGISGYSASGKWIIENAVGQYLSFDSQEAAFQAQKQSEDRRTQQAQDTVVSEADIPVVKNPEVGRPEASTEKVRANEGLEDRIFGSASREINNTLFGRITVKSPDGMLSFASQEEFEQARQGYLTRKEKREAAARESSLKEQSSAVTEASAQRSAERPLAAPAEAQPLQPPSAEEPTEEEMTPERAEMLRANQEAHNRYKGLDNLMTALRGVTDNELRDIRYRLQDARDGTAGLIFQLHRNFTDALNKSAASLMDAQRQTKEMVSIEGARVLNQAVQEQARAVDRAYEEMSEHLKSILNGGSLEYGTKTRADLEAYLGRTQAARQQLARLAQ